MRDIAGQRFGRLVAIRPAYLGPGQTWRWLCRCDCGAEHVARVAVLRNGTTRSCGCLQREAVTKHGESKGGPRKGTPEYHSWRSMIERCTSPRASNYARYGGRGIRVCDRWRDSFDNFLADMGRRPTLSHTLDRIDGDGNYEPNNCRWASPIEQSRNRKSNRINESIAAEIRAEAMAGVPQKLTSAKYGVDVNYVSAIKRGLIWKP